MRRFLTVTGVAFSLCALGVDRRVGEELRREAREQPEDLACRLILADWLVDHGDAAGVAQAELIRIDHTLAALAADAPERPELEARRNALIAAHGAEWTRGGGLPPERFRFAGGLPRGVTLQTHELNLHYDALATLGITDVKLVSPVYTGVEPALLTVLLTGSNRQPFLRQLRRLDLSDYPFATPVRAATHRLPPMPHLAELDLRGQPMTSGDLLQLSGRADRFPALRWLRLTGPVHPDTRRTLEGAFGRRPGFRLEIVE